MGNLIFLLTHIEDWLNKLDVWQLQVQDYWKNGGGKEKIQKFKKRLFVSVCILSGLSLLGIIGFIIGLTNRWDTMLLVSGSLAVGMILFIPWVANTSAEIISGGGSLLKVTKEPAKKLAEEINTIFKPFVAIALILAFINAYVILIGFQNFNPFWTMGAIAVSVFFGVQGLYFEKPNKWLGKATTAFVILGIAGFYTRYPIDPFVAKFFKTGERIETMSMKSPIFRMKGNLVIPDSLKILNVGDSIQVIDQRNLWRKVSGEKMIAARLPDEIGRFLTPDTIWIIARDIEAKTKTVLPKEKSFGVGEWNLSLKKGEKFRYAIDLTSGAKSYLFIPPAEHGNDIRILSRSGKTILEGGKLSGSMPLVGIMEALADMNNVKFIVSNQRMNIN